jgi:hypothetical protein
MGHVAHQFQAITGPDYFDYFLDIKQPAGWPAEMQISQRLEEIVKIKYLDAPHVPI